MLSGYIAWILNDEQVKADFRASCDQLTENRKSPSPPLVSLSTSQSTSVAAEGSGLGGTASIAHQTLPFLNQMWMGIFIIKSALANFISLIAYAIAYLTHTSSKTPSTTFSDEFIHDLYYRVRFAGSDAAAFKQLQELAEQGNHVAEAHLAIVYEARKIAMRFLRVCSISFRYFIQRGAFPLTKRNHENALFYANKSIAYLKGNANPCTHFCIGFLYYLG